MMSSLLLHWYAKNKRDLPWRLARVNPYKTWISEIMLQQTQVDTVLPYYHRFLKKFPDLLSLARAAEAEILTLWSGLGYYSRAKNLHKTAQILMKEYGGLFPATKERLKKLPGIGDYTAGAIASIAFEERVPLLDGNVLRVLSRVFAIAGDLKQTVLRKKMLNMAASLLPQKNIGDFNQSLMELGALVCTPSAPSCERCPVKKLCRAYRNNNVEKFPTPTKRAETIFVTLGACLIKKGEEFLWVQRGDDRHLKSMWEFPQIEMPSANTDPKVLKKEIKKNWNMRVELDRVLPKIKHSIMNRQIQLHPFIYLYKGGEMKLKKGYRDHRWLKLKDLKNYPTSSMNHKILRRLYG